MLACRLIVEYQVQRREYNWQLFMAKKNGKFGQPAAFNSNNSIKDNQTETAGQPNQTTEMTSNSMINDNQAIKTNDNYSLNTKLNSKTYQTINDDDDDRHHEFFNNNQHTKMD